MSFLLVLALGALPAGLAARERVETERVLSLLAEAPPLQDSPAFDTHPDLAEKAQPFLEAYFEYSHHVESETRRRLAAAIAKRPSLINSLLYHGKDASYSVVSPRARRARRTKKARDLRERWEGLYEEYRATAVKHLDENPPDPEQLIVVVRKQDFLCYLLDMEREQALLYLPVAYGANPDGDHKERFGDCRTPSTEDAWIDREFPIARPDINGYWLGIRIPNPAAEGKWWSRGGSIGLHGTPFRNTIGSKASHGCIRLFKEDSVLLARQIDPGTPVVIWP